MGAWTRGHSQGSAQPGRSGRGGSHPRSPGERAQESARLLRIQMTNYILRRLIYMLVVLFTVAGITFILMHAVPGGPFDKEKNLPPEIQAIKEKYYHLDDPLPVQFFSYLSLVTIPRFTTTPPTRNTSDDYLITVQMGNYWFKWMNFGPSITTRNRSV